MISQWSTCCAAIAAPAAYGRHDGEVAGGDHAHTVVAGEAVKLLVVAGGEPAGADDHMNTGSHSGPHVVLDCGGTGVVDQNINLRGLECLRDGGIDEAVAPRRS